MPFSSVAIVGAHLLFAAGLISHGAPLAKPAVAKVSPGSFAAGISSLSAADGEHRGVVCSVGFSSLVRRTMHNFRIHGIVSLPRRFVFSDSRSVCDRLFSYIEMRRRHAAHSFEHGSRSKTGLSPA